MVSVGVFSPSLSMLGGGEFVAIAMANALAQNGHEVTVFTSKKVDKQKIRNFFGESLHSSIKTVEQPTVITTRGLASFYQTIVRSYIAKSKCSMFVDPYSNCIFPWTHISYIHFPFLNQYSYKKSFPWIGSRHLLEVGSLPYVILEKNLVSGNGKLILANSNYTANEIMEYSGKHAHVLYPPFSSAIFEAGKDALKDPIENLVVTTSRFESDKKLERIPLIAAQTSKNVKFAIIGRLYNLQTLKNLQALIRKLDLNDRVTLYLDLPAQEKIALLKKAKIYLHTMVGEHFGIAVVEALALGCIPIVHNSGGLKEFVASEYRYDSLEEAASKIESALDQWAPQVSEGMRSIAGSYSMQNFSEHFMKLFNRYCA